MSWFHEIDSENIRGCVFKILNSLYREISGFN